MTDLAVLRLEGNRGIVGTLPRPLLIEHRLNLVDARGTSMQQPKFAAPDGTMTSVPDWMMMGSVTVSGDAYMFADGSHGPNCPYPLVKSATTLLLDPYYYQYEGCSCNKGDKAHIATSPDGTVMMFSCIPATVAQAQDAERLIRILEPTVVTLGVLLLVSVSAYAIVRYRSRSASDLLANKKRRPPQEGQPLTMVLTDVAGSTALWEWDTVQASQVSYVGPSSELLWDHIKMTCRFEVAASIAVIAFYAGLMQ
eukprot:GHUV01045493.1.p1 GENE.GHUV01045493.1~~GHUV01045493.1.p1  ORF type:complete len:293 (+),score=51.09 GHUV01045493.1:122-880(+)